MELEILHEVRRRFSHLNHPWRRNPCDGAAIATIDEFLKHDVD